jgi:cystathionine beta-lyase
MNVKEIRTIPGSQRPGTILRISIGLEDPEDLWADLEALFRIIARN